MAFEHKGLLLKTVFLVTILYVFAATPPPVNTKKSKLCGDSACEEVLFKTRVKRVMGITADPTFLKLSDGVVIDVVAVKFSDRVDLMEGKLPDGSKGLFYSGAIDSGPYVEFLRSAIEMKKEMQLISQDPNDAGSKRLIGVIHSETDLVRDYNAKAAVLAAENNLPPPDPLPIPQPPQQGHGHSHGAHGHSHGGHHGHSHGGHGHSHENNHVHEHSHVKEKPQEPMAPSNVQKMMQNEQVIADKPATEEKEAKQNPPSELNHVPVESIVTEQKMDDGKLPHKTAFVVEEKVENVQTIDNLNVDQQRQPEKQDNVEKESLQANVDTTNSAPSLDSSQTTPSQPPPPSTNLDSEGNERLSMEDEIELMIARDKLLLEQNKKQATAPVVEDTTERAVPVAATPVASAVESATEQKPLEIPPPQERPVESPSSTPPQLPALQPQPTVVQEAQPVVETPPIDAVIMTTTPSPLEATTVKEEEQVDPVANKFEAPLDVPASPVPNNAATEGSAKNEAPQGYCDKEDCSSLVNTAAAERASQTAEEDRLKAKPFEDSIGQFSDVISEHNFSNLPLQDKFQATTAVAAFVRSMLTMGDLSDASVGLILNITFVIVSFVIFVIVKNVTGLTESAGFDKGGFFTLSTRFRELQVILQNKEAELNQLRMSCQLQQVDQKAQNEVAHIRNELRSAKTDLSNAYAKISAYEEQLRVSQELFGEKEKEVEQLKLYAHECNEKLARSSEGSHERTKELDKLKAKLNEAEKESVRGQQEVIKLKESEQKLQQQLKAQEGERLQQRGRAEEFEKKSKELEGELKQAKIDNAALEELVQQYEKNQNEGSAAESGGSGGWSDFGDDFTSSEQQEEKTPDASQTDAKVITGGGSSPSSNNDKDLTEIRARLKRNIEECEELQGLRPQLQQCKEELARYKSLYEQEEQARNDCESKLKRLELDFESKRKMWDSMEEEKKESADRIKELLKMLTDNMKKCTDTESLISNLREDLYFKDKELREEQLQTRKKDDRIREIEVELKVLRSEYMKLEAKSFHDVMVLKRQLDDYKTSQILSQSSMPMASRDAFSANTSLDGDEGRIGLSPHRNDPIWDEPSHDYSKNGPSMPPSDFYPVGQLAKKTRSRRSDRLLMGENSPSDNEKSRTKIEKKDPHRRRSRSHGRQSYADPLGNVPYLTGFPSDSSYQNMASLGFVALSGRHSKSGQLNYSSGGSNGGRSPPPEMPLLSAIPPPGVRKPTGKRLDTSK
ncbi:unnamed protein product [Caenorhabditis auriculariae]|uniref:Transport and Golgi organization protein 1 n=1 Tax=Caenorhabditis auriculariae TaxID=2777116 RepID=A0A8S1GQV2_9PELO|nr:unnamed protein product [Caenorhabditis auriculariae]